MATNPKSEIRNPKSPILRPAIALTLFFIVAMGFAFPVLIWGISQVVFPHQANGSLIKDAKGNVIGSEIIGQSFAKPEYFHPRPSAAGNGYDAANSSGTNLGPTSDKLINGIHKKLPDGKDDPNNFDGIVDLAKAYRDDNGLAADALVPADAVTRSASGLDPDISPANAELQTPRVAKARGITVDQVKQLVADNTSGRFIGIYGEPRVNVLKLNLALDQAKH
ncbi:MAG: potassium-transporting ATPase subunit KdpC [Fimbriimonadales bacterium]